MCPQSIHTLVWLLVVFIACRLGLLSWPDLLPKKPFCKCHTTCCFPFCSHFFPKPSKSLYRSVCHKCRGLQFGICRKHVSAQCPSLWELPDEIYSRFSIRSKSCSQNCNSKEAAVSWFDTKCRCPVYTTELVFRKNLTPSPFVATWDHPWAFICTEKNINEAAMRACRVENQPKCLQDAQNKQVLWCFEWPSLELVSTKETGISNKESQKNRNKSKNDRKKDTVWSMNTNWRTKPTRGIIQSLNCLMGTNQSETAPPPD